MCAANSVVKLLFQLKAVPIKTQQMQREFFKARPIKAGLNQYDRDNNNNNKKRQQYVSAFKFNYKIVTSKLSEHGEELQVPGHWRL